MMSTSNIPAQDLAGANETMPSTTTNASVPQRTAAATAESAKSPLLALPPELRNMIYHACVSLQPQVLLDHTMGTLVPKGALHRVCRQTRHELGSIYEGDATELVVFEDGVSFARTANLINKLDPRTLSALREDEVITKPKSKATNSKQRQILKAKSSDLIARLASLRNLVITVHVTAGLSVKPGLNPSWLKLLDNPKTTKLLGLRIRYAFTATSTKTLIRSAIRSYLKYRVSWRLDKDSVFAKLHDAAAEHVGLTADWAERSGDPDT